MYILTQIVSFVSRTVFIKLLGDQYLGISGLYSNILSLLSLADLGIATAFMFALYKPLADKDYDKLAALLGFFKKLFILIAAVVLGVGMAFVPFLKYVIKDSAIEYGKLQLYFILSAINSACTYIAAYKSVVFRADQKVYVVNVVSAITNLLLHILQITLLYITKNYLFYLIATIAVTFIYNFTLTFLANRRYPEIFKRKPTPLSSEDKKLIFGNMKSLIVYRISAAIMNSTSNILISVILGTVIVGYYSNYAMIVSIVTAVVSIVSGSLLGSIGNLGATKDEGRRGELFHTIMLMYYGIATFCAVCFISIFNDFILFWLNDETYLLSQRDVYLIVFTFFINCISTPIWMFRESFGLFHKAKYVMTIAAVINIGFGILGGILLGVGGVIAATGLAHLVTLFWYEPRYLYKDAFKLPYKNYWLHVAYYMIQVAIVVLASIFITRFIDSTLLGMILKVLVCFAVSAIVFILFNAKTKEGKILVSKIKILVKRGK